MADPKFTLPQLVAIIGAAVTLAGGGGLTLGQGRRVDQLDEALKALTREVDRLTMAQHETVRNVDRLTGEVGGVREKVDSNSREIDQLLGEQGRSRRARDGG